MTYVNVTAVNEQALTVSGGETPTASTTIFLEDSISELYIFVKNTGSSTNLTITIDAATDESATIKAPLHTFTLNTTTTRGAVPVSVVPRYLVITGTNSDASNATTYSVIISKRA